MSNHFSDVPIAEAGKIQVRSSKYQESLQDSFAKEVATQASRMDDLAKQLISLNLAIPALYGAVLKITQGDSGTVSGWLVFIAFLSWLVALGFALVSLLPIRNKVDPNQLAALETYFKSTAQRKQILLIASSLISFFGICLVIFGLVL